MFVEFSLRANERTNERTNELPYHSFLNSTNDPDYLLVVALFLFLVLKFIVTAIELDLTTCDHEGHNDVYDDDDAGSHEHLVPAPTPLHTESSQEPIMSLLHNCLGYVGLYFAWCVPYLPEPATQLPGQAVLLPPPALDAVPHRTHLLKPPRNPPAAPQDLHQLIPRGLPRARAPGTDHGLPGAVQQRHAHRLVHTHHLRRHGLYRRRRRLDHPLQHLQHHVQVHFDGRRER